MRWFVYGLWTTVYGLATLLVVSPADAAAVGEIQAGVGRETFSLPSHVPLAGYSRRKGRPSQGLHDPVGVRALVIREGTTTAALASCDLLVIDERLFDAVRRRAIEGGLPPDTLFLVAATHTHSGPGAYGARFLEKHSMGHFDPAVFEAVAGAIAQALIQAHRTLSPVRTAFRSSQTHGLLRNRVDVSAETDNELTVYAVYRYGEAQPMAVLVGFAAHPTTLGAWNRELSADYPGVVMREVERRFPGAACLFFAGAVGDQAPVKHGDGFEAAEYLGQQLAAQVVALLDRAASDAPQRLLGFQEGLPLPPARVRVNRVTLPQWLSARLVDDEALLSLVAVGGIVFLGVPCDLTVSLGHVLKDAARSNGLQPVIVGFANDYIGYCVPETLYAQPAYESFMAFNGPKAGELVVQRLTAMIGHLVTSAEAAVIEQYDGLRIVHLSGTPYELGYQHGTVLKEQVQASVRQILGYFRRYLKIPFVRSWAANWWLDRPWRAAAPFVPSDYLDELRGLADGSGVPLRELYRLHAIPDRTYSCANFAAWGRVTSGGRLIHLRNLDWNIDVGIQQFATVFVVHAEGKRAFINLGWAGFIGVLTGVNDAQLSIGQVGAETVDATFRGEPMVFVMRRVLEEADTLEEAAGLIRSTRRTVGVNYVIADAKTRAGIILETTHRQARVFEADDPAEYAVAYARPMLDAVFRADTAMDPGIRDGQLASHGDPRRPGLESPVGSSAYDVRYLGQAEGLQAAFGQLDPLAAQEIARAIAPSSNVQSVVFAWPDVWVANADGTTRAAQTAYHRLNAQKLFASPHRP